MKGLEELAEIILNEAIKASQTAPKQKQEEPETDEKMIAQKVLKLYKAFKGVGFNCEQSFELTKIILNK